MDLTQFQKVSFFLLRLAMGWLMLYAGVTKVLNPDWTAVGYLKGAKTFIGFYNWLASPNILPVVNFLNEWGLTLIGISLILGALVKLSSVLGATLMVLYYFPVLEFPYIGKHAFLIDEHIIYSLVFIVLAAFRVGRIWGFDNWWSKLPINSRFPTLQNWLG